MKIFESVVLALCCLQLPLQAHAEELWFTVMGNLADSDTDTVQLNLAKVGERGKIDVMQLRVSLAQPRNINGDEKFQSYVSKILIDCRKDAIVHLEQTRFESARWEGPSKYQAFPEVRPMAFGGLAPNPTARVLRAACAEKTSGSVKQAVP